MEVEAFLKTDVRVFWCGADVVVQGCLLGPDDFFFFPFTEDGRGVVGGRRLTLIRRRLALGRRLLMANRRALVEGRLQLLVGWRSAEVIFFFFGLGDRPVVVIFVFGVGRGCSCGSGRLL